jgi:hypothetical protein
MKKLIDIPDEIVKNLKIEAVKNDESFKAYLEQVIINSSEFSKVTEMAMYALDDRQAIRPFWNYIANTFDGLKDKEWNNEEGLKFTDRIEFYTFLKQTLEWMIQVAEEEAKDE